MEFLARFVGIWLVFVVYIAVDVEGVAYNAACTGSGTGDCTETTNIVCDGTCKCTTDSFRKADNSACESKIALTAACTTTPTGQCADSNADCAGSVCTCNANFFKNKNTVCVAVVGLDGSCDSTDNSAGQCSVTNTECRDDGAGDKCLCESTYFSDGTACQTRLVYGATCSNTVTATNQCAVTNQVCSLDTGTAYKCQCTAAYYDDDGTNGCVARKKPDEACAAGQCVTDATCNTVDGSLKCECDTGFTATPAVSSTMCSGVAKFATLSYMYVVPILVSMMFLFR